MLPSDTKTKKRPEFIIGTFLFLQSKKKINLFRFLSF